MVGQFNRNAQKQNKSMKKYCLYLLLTIGLAISSQAGVYNAGPFTDPFNPSAPHNGTIPDGDLSGWVDSRSLSFPENVITDVKVSLTINPGGWNGDLYGYLKHGSDTVVLLNRVGKGTGNTYGFGPTTGMNVTLWDGASQNIHDVAVPADLGSYKPDGRGISPLSGNAAFDLAGTQTLGAAFNGKDPNGTWTLFLADASSLGVSTIGSWSLEITAVPEPVTVALGIFGVLFGAVQGVRYLRRKGSVQ
jgi:hypothetical protein